MLMPMMNAKTMIATLGKAAVVPRECPSNSNNFHFKEIFLLGVQFRGVY